MAPIATAEIIAVGSELLTPARLDTNSLYITGRLNELGIAVRLKTVVGDSRPDVEEVFRAALARSALVVLTGGLGPTEDDVTREVVAGVLGRPLHEDAELVVRLEARFASRGLDMPAINRRQAMVPAGAEILPNRHGTAPGLLLEHEERIVVLLPGPPREMRALVDGLVDSHLRARAGDERLHTRVVRIAGRTESHVEQGAQPLYERWRREGRGIDVTILASPGSIDLHLTVRGHDAAAAAATLETAVGELHAALAPDVYSDRGEPMEQVVGALLAARGWTVAAAESCTGGLLTSRLTDVPGSSAYVERAVVAYSNAAKTELLGVDPALIATHGAVSEPVARAMAAGIRAGARTTIGIGITGIAGPAGGTADKPVGTVAIAVEGPWGAQARTRTFPGGREQIKFHASQAALDDLRRAMLRR